MSSQVDKEGTNTTFEVLYEQCNQYWCHNLWQTCATTCPCGTRIIHSLLLSICKEISNPSSQRVGSPHYETWCSLLDNFPYCIKTLERERERERERESNFQEIFITLAWYFSGHWKPIALKLKISVSVETRWKVETTTRSFVERAVWNAPLAISNHNVVCTTI